MLGNIINLFFIAYTSLLFIRIIGSWFPAFSSHPIMRFVYFYTEPYLNIFRRIIPPIKGVLDLSPLLAFFVLRIVQSFFLKLFR